MKVSNNNSSNDNIGEGTWLLNKEDDLEENTRRNDENNESKNDDDDDDVVTLRCPRWKVFAGVIAAVIFQVLLAMAMRASPAAPAGASSSSSCGVESSFHKTNVHHNKVKKNTSSSTEAEAASASSSPTGSKYKRVQGMGFQIYTGGAPAYLVNKTTGKVTTANPECVGRSAYGNALGDEEEGIEDEIQCYLGKDDPISDIHERLDIMRLAVDRAYEEADHFSDTLKVFIAPEFFWRGIRGAYRFSDEDADDPSTCGPICLLLKGLENIVAHPRFENWLFLFGTIVAYETLPADAPYDFLFYNFAPIYKGYDPAKMNHTGKRFLAPKRYVSGSDFLTPARYLNASVAKELVAVTAPHNVTRQARLIQHLDDEIIFNAHDDRQKYDYDAWEEYQEELSDLGYALIEYGWLMVDGLSISVEICLDHQMHTALNAYLADITTGRRALIPSSSDDRGLEYVHIPAYQAQVSLVSSAGMSAVPESMALTNNGTLFLQDGLSNATNAMEWKEDGCDSGLQFKGGTEALQRRAFLSATDIIFEHTALNHSQRVEAFDDWEDTLQGLFTTKVYKPQMTIFNPVDIPQINALK